MVLGHVLDGDRTEDVLTSNSITFASMLLEPNTLCGLKSSGFFKPSPIQLCGIPLGKCGFDLLLEAKSGTGKTAVFTVIALEKINLNKGLQTVILAPTREIAAQICDVIKQIGSSYDGLKVEVVMGGLPFEEDVQKFKGGNVHIVVGSPGRLRHLIQEKYIQLSAVRLLVLDEADKLVEKSFMLDINYIFSILPKEKQVIMSSATFPEKARTFIKNYVQNAQHVCPDSSSILLGIQQKVTTVQHNSNIVKQTKYRFEELAKILSTYTFKQCLIFCNYQARVADIHKLLTRNQWPAQQLYGQQEQVERLDALRSLQEYKCRILISTDLAARGIDASNVDLIINFEPPHEWQTYLHRIGRAGRFGSYGVAITILSEGNEQEKFKEILKAINAPINLSNLWTDGELVTEVQNGCSYTEQSTTEASPEIVLHQKKSSLACSNDENGINYAALWNILSNEVTENNNLDIESFENLCNSFGRPEIESFFDLMDSLQIYEPTKPKHSSVNDTYSCLQVPITEYLKTVNDIISKYSKQENKILLTPTGLKPEFIKNNSVLENNNDVLLNVVNDVLFENGTDRGPEHNETVINEETFSTVTDKTESFMHTSRHVTKKDEVDEYYVPDISEDLLKAGLPTAFSSSKNKNNNFKRKNSHENLNNAQFSTSSVQHTSKNIDNLLHTNVTNENTSQEREKRKTYKKSFKNVFKDSLITETENNARKSKNNTNEPSNSSKYEAFCSSKNKHGTYFTTSSSTSESDKNECSSFNSFQYNKPDMKSRKHYQERHNSNTRKRFLPRQEVSNRDYINWYQNLKLKVKQIEFTIFVDELSKL